MRTVIGVPENKIYVSAASAFEIAIKAKLGRLTDIGDPLLSVPFHMKRSNFLSLAISVEASLRVFSLPNIHEDPFDRLLIAQAMEHSLTLITNDDTVRKYPVQTLS